MRIAPFELVGAARHRAGRRRVGLEQRGQRHAQAGREFFEQHGRRTALAALDQRDHGAADAAVRGQGVEREIARGAQGAHALGDAVVEAGGRS
ncbi:hypothetical protein D3C72_2067610 [compost metagenome]